jgi:hypothetical protein
MKAADLVPFAMTMLALIRDGMDHYATLSGLPEEMRQPAICLFLLGKMEKWNPQIAGIEVMTPEARQDAASFLARISMELARATDKKGAA